MKPIPFVLPMLTVAVCGFLLIHPRMAKTQIPSGRQTATSKNQVLFDFRREQNYPPVNIPSATERSVLSKLFRRYLTDPNKCNPNFDASSDSDPLRAARNVGQIVPSILDVAQGSFTGPLLTQTAYVISVSECNASHADNFGTKRVAIFSDDKLIANVDVDFKRDIVRKTDLNGDGIDELLMTTGDMNQGTVIEIAALVDFQNGRFRVIEDFGTVIDDECPSGRPGSSSNAAVISITDALTGKMPQFKVNNYKRGCNKASRWRFVSSGKVS